MNIYFNHNFLMYLHSFGIYLYIIVPWTNCTLKCAFNEQMNLTGSFQPSNSDSQMVATLNCNRRYKEKRMQSIGIKRTNSIQNSEWNSSLLHLNSFYAKEFRKLHSHTIALKLSRSVQKIRESFRNSFSYNFWWLDLFRILIL